MSAVFVRSGNRAQVAAWAGSLIGRPRGIGVYSCPFVVALPMTSPDRTRRLVLLAVGGVGVAAVMTQLALLRELLGAFSGNELVFGIGLGSWLLLTGFGTWLGRYVSAEAVSQKAASAGLLRRLLRGTPRNDNLRPQPGSQEAAPASPAGAPAGDSARPTACPSKPWRSRVASYPKPDEARQAIGFDRSGGTTPPPPRARAEGGAGPASFFIAGLLCLAVFPLLQVGAVRMLRDVVFIRGAAVGVAGTLLGTLALLLPFCLVSGLLLTLACALLDRGREAAVIGRVYVADSLGSIGGGMLFSFVLVPWFDHFALLCFPAALNLLLAGALAWHFRRRVLLGSTIIIAAGLAAHLALIDADKVTTAVQYWGRPVVFRANSPYGRLVITDDSGQLTFFENGVPVISTQNVEHVEETVHYAMSQRPDARQVLVISGGVTGTAREILRYGVKQVVSVELDPLIITAGRRFLPGNLADPRIRTVAADGRRFVQQTREQFDVVIIDVPDPTTAQLNRFYTAEFFAEVHRVLTPGGVVSFGLGHYENYVSPELARLLASAHRAARSSFAHIRLIPGGRVFFLASDGPLTLDIAARIEDRGLATKLVNRHYLDATLAPDRLADLDRAVAQPAAINTDFAPALDYYQLRHWLSQFDSRAARVCGGLAALGILFYLLTLRAVPRLIFASGFTASAIEVVLLLGFQALYGSLYRQVGLVVTVFMAGIAAGAWLASRTLRQGNRPGPVAARADPVALSTGEWTTDPKTARWRSRLLSRPSARWRSQLLSRLSARWRSQPHPDPGAPSPGQKRNSRDWRQRNAARAVSCGLAALAAGLPLALPRLGRIDALLGTALVGQGIILLVTFGLALLVGAQFPLAAASDPGANPAVTASRLYTADLAGAALGALLAGALLVPLFGMTTVCLLTAALNLIVAILV